MGYICLPATATLSTQLPTVTCYGSSSSYYHTNRVSINQSHLFLKMFLFKSFSAIILAVILSICVKAETHTVVFINKCGFGTPTLIQGPNIRSTGEDYVTNGPLLSAIAYLQTESCGFNGEGCTVIETTLINPNPTSPGSGSSSDISLISPHTFSVTSGFRYFNGCDGTGVDCTSLSCSAFRSPEQTYTQIACQEDNVNLAITFCD